MLRFRLVVALGSLALLAACGDPPDEGPGDKPKKAEILSFEVAPTTLPSGGGTVTLTWRTRNVKSAAIEADGERIATPEELDEGSLDWEVETTTTFRLVVTGEGGNDAREARVEVGEDLPRIVSFGATPSTIEKGQTAVLAWETENAESVRIVDGSGTPLDLGGAGAGEGSVEVSPVETTTYTLEARRGERTTEASTTVTVESVELEIVTFEAVDPGARAPGESVEFRWVVRGATSLVLSNLEGFEETIVGEEVAAGTRSAPMGEQGKFRLVAENDEGLNEAKEVTIPILVPPAIRTFYANPQAVSEPGGSTTFFWDGVERAASLRIERDPGAPIELEPTESGSVEIEMDAPTTFVLVAENAAGSAKREVFVDLVPLPVLTSLRATPARVGAGEFFTLSWRSEHATRITMETADGPHPRVSDWMVDHDLTDLQIFEDTEFVLRLYNDADDYVEERLTVTVGAPEVVSLGFSPPFVGVGGNSTLEWSFLGGVSLEVVDADGNTVCTAADVDAVESGSCVVDAPVEGAHVFEVRVVNGVGDETVAEAMLLAGSGPFVVSLTASPELLEPGDAVEISWEVLEDPLGDPMELTLTDGTTVYDVSDRNPTADSKSFVLNDVGTYEFTLTATSVNGSRSLSTEVRVVGQPTVTLAASSEEYDGIQPVALSWTSENADGGLVLYEVGAGGQLVELFDVPEAERASGSFEVEPNQMTTYRIVADNGAGSTASAEVVVDIGPPVITSFEADPVEVMVGDDVTVSWSTRFADEVVLNLPTLTLQGAEVQGDPFTDISSTGTPLVLTQDCAWDPAWFQFWEAVDEGCATIAFPSGFTFPFGGASHSSIRAYANGSLSFDFTHDEATYFNREFPTPVPIHIAPFWDDLYLDGGGIWYSFGNDARGQYLIVQWEGSLVDVDLEATAEFQAVLWEDGAFAFRYGSMTGVDSDAQDWADGASAIIGYQAPDQSTWVNLHAGAEGFALGQPVAGGLSGRTWWFEYPALSPNGSQIIQPPGPLTLTLKAIGPKGEATASLDVVVHQPVELEAYPPDEEPQAGWPFTVGWRAEHASLVEVLDDQNAVLCTSAPGEVREGGCQITEANPGTYSYVVRAHGPLAQVRDEIVEVEVFPTFVVEVFEADPPMVPKGQNESVTVTWLTHGAVSIELTANGVDILPSGASPSGGSVVYEPTETTTFALTVSSADGRTRTREITVDVYTVVLQASVDTTSVTPGGGVTLSWDATPISSGTPTMYLPMREVASAYTDISTDPDAVELIGAGADDTIVLHTFANGFQFPWGGEMHSQVAVFVPGYISFDPLADWEFTPEPFPTWGTEYVHIAPFWDDLHTRVSGRVHALAQSDGSYVIQWSHVSRFHGSSDANEYDLNFQLVLFPDGAFEFRYGTMAPPPIAFDFSCTQLDCTLDAQGASAGIGYQNPLATVGVNLHYGPDWFMGDNQPFPGGLDNRSFRKDGGSSGSVTFYPERTTGYGVCAEFDGYLTCESFEVEVEDP